MTTKSRKKKSPGTKSRPEKAGPSAKPTLTLRLDAAFYPSRAVEESRKAFAHLAEIQVRREGNQQVIRFTGMSQKVAKKLPDEFANYALSCNMVDG